MNAVFRNGNVSLNVSIIPRHRLSSDIKSARMNFCTIIFTIIVLQFNSFGFVLNERFFHGGKYKIVPSSRDRFHLIHFDNRTLSNRSAIFF